MPTCSLALLYLRAPLDFPTHPTPSPLACTVRPALHGHGTLSHRHIARELRFELRITCTNGRTYHTCNQPCSILYLRAPLDWPTHPTLYLHLHGFQGHLFHGDGTPPHYHHTAIVQFEPSNMVSAALCVTTVVVCVVTQDDQAVACYPWGVGAYRPSALWRP